MCDNDRSDRSSSTANDASKIDLSNISPKGICHALIAKRCAETLTSQEQATLIEISDQIEQANARRIQYLIELANLRGTSLETLMQKLGIEAPAYV